MTDRSKQSGEQESTAAKQDEFATRRTVIQGIASVAPVVMTLSSGEALANSSSLQCIKEPPFQPPECIKKYQSDEWLRKYTEVEAGESCSKTATWSWKTGWTTKESCTTKKTTKQCLVYVDESGYFTSKKKGGTPLTRSCYNSFLPKKK
jgi:hypothetical protein